MAGDSRGSFAYVEFTRNANASIEDLDKIPFLTTYQALHFHDTHNNYLRLSPKAESVYGRFVQGKEILACLPRNYVSYELSLGKDVVITTEDIEAMLTWREAGRIMVTDMANLAYDLSLHIDEMPKKWHLERLVLTVQRHSYKELNVKKLLDQVSMIGSARFEASPSMTADDLIAFYSKQGRLYPYNCKIIDRAVVCN